MVSLLTCLFVSSFPYSLLHTAARVILAKNKSYCVSSLLQTLWQFLILLRVKLESLLSTCKALTDAGLSINSLTSFPTPYSFAFSASAILASLLFFEHTRAIALVTFSAYNILLAHRI